MPSIPVPTSLLSQYLTAANILGALFTYILVNFTIDLLFSPKYPTSVPWVGYGKSPFATFKSLFGGLTKSRQWMQDGYDLYSKRGKTFVFPATIGSPPQTILPPSQIRWMIDQPDNVLSTQAAHYDQLHGDFAFVSKRALKDPYHEHIIHKNLARNLNHVIPDLDDEVSRDIDELLGMDTENWRSLEPLEDIMMGIIPKITNRMLVGEPLCRNPGYINHTLGFAIGVIRNFLLFTFIPKSLHSFVGSITGLSAKYHFWHTLRHVGPVIKQRVSDMAKKDAGDPEYKDWKEPNDYITWTIRTATAEGRLDELQANRIALRILPLNFASIHTTALTATAVLLDILSSPPEAIESLREEALRIYTENNQKWTKSGLSVMYRIDSAIRESQRMSAISLSFVERKVVAKEGIVSPEGIHLAYRTRVAVPWLPLAYDDEHYEKPDVFDPFRFSRAREAYEALSTEEKAKQDGLKLMQTSLVTTNERHLPFGHGRHACPGRFFVAHEIKIMIGHLLIHYDLKPLKERPQPMWVGKTQIPAKATVEFRRRKLE